MAIGRIFRAISLVAIVSAAVAGCSNNPMYKGSSYDFNGEINGNHVVSDGYGWPSFSSEIISLNILTPKGITIHADGSVQSFLDNKVSEISITRIGADGNASVVPITLENVTELRGYITEIYNRNIQLGI